MRETASTGAVFFASFDRSRGFSDPVGGLRQSYRILYSNRSKDAQTYMLAFTEKNSVKFDLISLGEILLRFDPGDRRIHNARQFTVWDGGAEYNVAANLSRVFQQRTAIVTALADNAIGRLAEDFARQAGVDRSELRWDEDDGSSDVRNGFYFIERGFGVRAPASAFDRRHTAVSKLKAGDIDWKRIFEESGTRWFHTGGVFTGLSESTPDVAEEAMKAARDSGAVVSYDLNYRDSLWRNRGGREAANAVNRSLLPHADVVFGTFDFDSTLSKYHVDSFRISAEKMLTDFPELQIVASTLRETHSASRHDVAGVCLADGGIYRSSDFTNVEVLDRVGSGDAFAAGFIWGILEGQNPQFAIDCGAAHGAFAMTTPGDVSMATVDDVLGLMRGHGSSAKR